MACPSSSNCWYSWLRSVAAMTCYLTVPLLLASLVNGVVALALFPLLDRLRKS